jgi:hypothetical protein
VARSQAELPGPSNDEQGPNSRTTNLDQNTLASKDNRSAGHRTKHSACEAGPDATFALRCTGQSVMSAIRQGIGALSSK